MLEPNNYLQKTFNLLPTPSIIIQPNSPNFSIVAINDAYINLTNNTKELLVGQHFYQAFANNTNSNVFTILNESLNIVLNTNKSHIINQLRLDIANQDNDVLDVKYWLVENTPILKDDGSIEIILQTITDITEKTLLQNQKTEYEKENLELQTILKNIDTPTEIGTWELHLETGKLFLSNNYFKICGFEPNAFVPTVENTALLIHPEDRERADKAHANAIETMGSYRIEKRIIRPNGEIITVLSTGLVTKNDAGKAVTMTGIFENITGTKQLEKVLRDTVNSLKERNEFIETIIKNLPIGIAVNKIDDGTATMLNSRFSEIYGWQESDFKDVTTFFEKVYPDADYRKIITEKIINDIQSGDASKMHWNDITITTSTGEKRIINAKNIPLFDQNLMISTVMDVTDTAKQTAEINRIKNNREAIINSTDDIIFSLDKNLKLVTVNKVYQMLLKSITGRVENEGDVVLTGMLGKELTTKWKSYFERAFKGEKFAVNEEVFNPMQGITQYGLVNFNPVFNSDGEVESVACFAKDVTASTVSHLQLQKTKNELDKILAASLDVICVVNKDNVFVKVSAASEKVWGYKPEELIGHSIFEFIHPDYAAHTKQATLDIMKGQDVTNFENRYVKKDGLVVTIEWSARWDDKEQMRYGIARDITEKKKNELALIESNLRYNYVTKATSDAIYDWNLEDNSVFWGDVFFKIFGWDLQKKNAKIDFCFDRIHPNDKDKLLNDLFTAINGTAITWAGEYRFLKADDSYAYVTDQAYIIRDINNKAFRVVGSKRDVTVRRQELIRLKLLESVITNTNDVVVISEAEAFDASGPKIVYVNEAFTKLTGYQPEEIIGKTQSLIQGPKTDPEELAKLKDYMEALKPCEITLINYKKDNEEYWVNINLNPVMDENGRITHWVSLQRDVTDKKQQEINMMKAIIKTQEDERYEVGGELHDNVCQILTGSQIALKMIKKSLPETDLQRLIQGIDYITQAIQEIRNLSHRLAPAFFNDTTLDEAFENLVKSFNVENNYHIHLNFDAEFKTLPAKREFQLNLYRILQEQLKNILKYSAATSIDINGYVENGYLILSVYDNGVGFDVTSVKKGIGIANMKRRVELFSGKFSIQSSEGSGCTILIEIPIKEIN